MGSPHATGDTVVKLVDELVATAIRRRASDIHFDPGEPHMTVRFRLDGLLTDADRLPRELAENVIARLKVLAGLLTYRIDVPQEGSFRLEPPVGGLETPLDLRVATFPTIRGERAVVRLLHTVGQVNGLDELGLSREMAAGLATAATAPHGLLLVTGPAGSGKSTTLYALARHLLSTAPWRSVVSLEDPVEQRLAGMTQMQVSPHGELDYVRAMRSLLRQDVEVLLVGEIRDDETAHIVVESSLTGHLVMSTMHSGDPAEAIVRLLEMSIAPYQLVGAVTLVASQRLLRKVCRSCGGKGCEACQQTGFHGRTACGEVAVMSDRLRAMILRHPTSSELRAYLATAGPSLAQDARRVVDEGLTTAREAARVLGTMWDETIPQV